MKVEFDKISDESRIWVYQSNEDFTVSDVNIINKKSKNYLKVYKISLSETVNACLWVPSDYAHGFFVKSKYAIVCYKTTSYYNPKYERGLNYKSNLLELNFNSKVLVSKKDKLLPRNI